jgi:putative inorganic carbon (HCO3(-)) transporter
VTGSAGSANVAYVTSGSVTALISIVIFLVYVNAPTVVVGHLGLPTLFAAAVPMLLVLLVAHRVVNHGEVLRFPGLIIAALLMLACHTVSALVSSRPDLGMNNVFEWLLEGVFLAFLLVNILRTRDEVFGAARAIVAAGAVMGFLVILQQVFGLSEQAMAGFGKLGVQVTDTAGQVQHRLTGPIGEVNFFAQIMAVLIPVAAGLALTTRGRQRWLYWIATFLICVGMALTYSRGTMVALVLVVPFALLFGFLRPRHFAVIALCGTLLITASPYLAKRVTSIGQVAMQSLGLSPGGFRGADGASRGRVTEMQAAGLLFLDHPLVGAGPGMAPVYYPEYAVLVGGKVRGNDRRTHSLYLQLAAETGLVGLTAFLGLIAMVLLPLNRSRRRLQHSDRQLWGLVCGLELAVLVQLSTNLFLHAAYIRYFWLLLALAVAAASLPGRATMTNFLFQTPRNVADRIRTPA